MKTMFRRLSLAVAFALAGCSGAPVPQPPTPSPPGALTPYQPVPTPDPFTQVPGPRVQAPARNPIVARTPAPLAPRPIVAPSPPAAGGGWQPVTE